MNISEVHLAEWVIALIAAVAFPCWCIRLDEEFSNPDWVSYRTSAFGDLETLLDFIRTTVMVWEGPAEKPQTVADITKPPK